VYKSWVLPFLILTVGYVMPGSASAQDTGKFAVAVGTLNIGESASGSVGVLWQFAHRFAVRPDFTYSYKYSQYNNLSYGNPGFDYTQHTTTTTTGLGISGPISIYSKDNLRLYVSPRFAFYRTSISSGVSGSFHSSSESSSWGPYSARLSFGAQYALSHRFAVYGDSGIENVWSKTPISQFGSSTRSSNWQTTTAIGLLVYF